MSVTTWIKKLQGDHSVIRRALRFIEEGDLDSAERALVEGNESFPDNWMIKYHLAYCLVLKRDFERAVAALKDGGLRYVNAETLDNVFGWCNSMEVAKEYVPAITLYNLIGEMFPGEDAAKAYFHAARVHRFANQTHKMIESFVRSTEHGDYPECFPMFYEFMSEEERLALLAKLPRLIEISRTGDRHWLNLAIADIYQQNFDYESATKFISKTRDLTRWKDKRRVVGKVRLPGYLIIGTVKSGSTSMFHTLGNHPQIFNAVRKEIHFFDTEDANTLWYRSHFPRLPDDFHAVTGEASPNYLYCDCMDKVKEVLPNVKLICMLRDPTERAISQYYHATRLGNRKKEINDYFDVKPFEALMKKPDHEIEDELFKIASGERFGNRSISFSHYYYYLRRWFRKFDSSNMLLVNFEEYCREPQPVLSQICDFLEIDQYEFEELGDRYQGNYDTKDPQLDDIRHRLQGLFAEPNRLLREEFGVEFNTSSS